MKKYLPAVILAFLYVITGEISFLLLGSNKIVTIGVFIPEGIALAFALYFGYRVIPGIFIGQLILAVFNGMGIFDSIAVGIINSLEAALGIYLAEKLRISKSLKTFEDFLKLGGLIMFILQPFSAVFSNLILSWNLQVSYTHIFYATFSWWFGNVMGQLLFTPFLLLLFNRYKKINLKEMFLYGALYAFYIYVLEIVLRLENSFVLVTLSLMAVVWVTIKKGLLYGAFLNVIAFFIASISVYLKTGAFSISSQLENTINFNLYLLAHIIIVYMIGILFEERKRYECYLEERIKEEIEKNKKQQILMIQQNRLAQMGELLSMIAHQWRQPLNNLALLNQVVIRKYKKGVLDDDSVKFFSENSQKQIEYMSNIINWFMNFFKDDSKEEEFSIKKVLLNTVELIKPTLDKNKIDIEIEVDDDTKIKGYKNSFAQAVLNIINNAKEVLISNNPAVKKIIIQAKKENGNIKIYIKDTAGGIPEDILDKIFDPYFSTKDEKNGSGLGLYMSKMIIEDKMEGRLEAVNDEKGACFIITLKDSNA
ncbi:MAG: ATP-binding protein [Nautiliaceae bacterium]